MGLSRRLVGKAWREATCDRCNCRWVVDWGSTLRQISLQISAVVLQEIQQDDWRLNPSPGICSTARNSTPDNFPHRALFTYDLATKSTAIMSMALVARQRLKYSQHYTAWITTISNRSWRDFPLDKKRTSLGVTCSFLPQDDFYRFSFPWSTVDKWYGKYGSRITHSHSSARVL